MKITLTRPDAVFLDGQPVGTAAEFIHAHPDKVDGYTAALAAYYEEQHSQARAALQTQLTAARKENATLKALNAPVATDIYLLVVELPAVLEGANHFGLRRFERGGAWSGDLLRQIGDNQFTLVKADGLSIPASAKVSSLSELTKANLEKDLTAFAHGSFQVSGLKSQVSPP